MALSDTEVQQVRLTLVSSGWTDVMKPRILMRAQNALKALVLDPTERGAFKGTDFDTSDAVLRAMIRDAEWMAVCWDNEVQIADRNRQRDELARAENT